VDTAKDPEGARSALLSQPRHGKVRGRTDKAGWGTRGGGWACAGRRGWRRVGGPLRHRIGGNPLYRNNHDGTFADITERAGVAGGGWSTGCGFADSDRDGDSPLRQPLREARPRHLPEFGGQRPASIGASRCRSAPAAARHDRPPLPQRRQRAFTEVSEAGGVSDPRGYFGLGIAWFDYNGDGWRTCTVANDPRPASSISTRRTARSRRSRSPWAWP